MSEAVQIEVVPPDWRKRVELLEAKLAEFVDRRIVEVQARQGDRLFQPFFESRKVTDELRRLSFVPELHRWRICYERWACIDCKGREAPHAALGFCQKCYNRWRGRLSTIERELTVDRERAEAIIDLEMQARKAFATESLETLRPLLAAPVAPQEETATKKPMNTRAVDAGKRMRNLRIVAGLTQPQLAKLIGVATQTVKRFEWGQCQFEDRHCEAAKRVLAAALAERKKAILAACRDGFLSGYWPELREGPKTLRPKPSRYSQPETEGALE